MDTNTIAQSNIGKLFIRILAAGMESRFRYRFFGPMRILRGVNILSRQTVLEVGCGTGYFTLPVATLIGDKGKLVAIDVVPESVHLVSQKVKAANLKNVQVIEGDAQKTGLDTESFDTVLLFGIIPAPMLPLARLLPEMHRILKVNGTLAVWPPIPGWLPQAIRQSGLFTFICKRNGVYNFRRS
jgi:demethylmenaquinone methyltransferase/2-methoxy-6-polyprenyl-1,4-benzoquinol methylase